MRLGLLADLERSSSKYFDDRDAQIATSLLIEIDSVTRLLGARTMYLFVPEKAQVFLKPDAPLRASVVIRSAVEQTGSPWVDATEAAESDEIDSIYFSGDAYWSPYGHRWIANLLKERIVELSFLDPLSNSAGTTQ